jgi:hypothetical protein
LAVAHGRICSHRGWTHQNGRQKRAVKTYHGFVNPVGQRVVITDLRKFCREHGLQIVKMYHVMSGKRHQHKGWIWKDESDD